jgi:hypothetical protein
MYVEPPPLPPPFHLGSERLRVLSRSETLTPVLLQVTDIDTAQKIKVIPHLHRGKGEIVRLERTEVRSIPFYSAFKMHLFSRARFQPNSAPVPTLSSSSPTNATSTSSRPTLAPSRASPTPATPLPLSRRSNPPRDSRRPTRSMPSAATLARTSSTSPSPPSRSSLPSMPSRPSSCSRCSAWACGA